MKKILLLANFSSGTGNGRNRLTTLIKELALSGCQTTVFPIIPSEGLGSENILSDIDFDFDGVVCLGGDGTLNHLINTLYSHAIDTVIGYMPTGSANDFASSLYGTRNLEIRDLCRGIKEDRIISYDVSRFNDTYFNYIAAFGAFTKVSYATDQNFKNTFGYLAYMLSAISALPEALSFNVHARITFDDEVVEGNYLLGGVSNTTSVGGMSLPIFAQSQLSDGMFEVILLKTPGNVVEWNDMIGMLLSGKVDNDRILQKSTRHLTVELDREVPWTLDGEDGGVHGKVEFSIREKQQRIFMPVKR